MAIAYVFELPGVTQAQGEAIIRELQLQGKPLTGQVLHLEGPMDGGGIRVVDVWESQESLDAFFRDQLIPAANKLGIKFPENLKPTVVWPVSAVLK